MKTTSTFSILFWADFSRVKNGQVSIYARVTVNGKRATISLKRKISVSDWDAHKNRARGTNQKSRTLNSYLDETYNHLFKCYRDLMTEHKLITSQAIKARYFGQDENNHSILDIINYHNEDMVSKLKWGTQKNYFTTHKYIFLFLKQKHQTTDIYLSELSYKFIIDFERFLRHQKSMGNNTS
jgi:integrase/recombinase XerD